MTKRNKKFYITTPLYYVNAAPHIGHSYTQIATDTVARFHKQRGEDVFFMTGTDEHGEKIEKSAVDNGYQKDQVKQFIDTIIPNFRKLWEDLDIGYDYFIRTTDDYHERTVQHLLGGLYEKGDIYKGEYDGLFCIPCETFWSDGAAPGGVCPDCKRPADRIKEQNYFLKISAYQEWLIGYIEKNPDFIMPEYRKNEVLAFLRGNKLNDLCISRSRKRFGWGIELPFDKDYVTYVWVDALINYISGAGYPHDKDRFERLWPADFHIIGKDILRHHAVYWPIMLRAAGIEPPRTIFAHGWWTVKGDKMSKSKGNIVDPYYIIGKYGVDPYRYFLLREVPFGLDGGFSEEALVGRYNSDLANDLGNLLNRTLTMVEKYFGGRAPRPRQPVNAGFAGDASLLAKKLSESMLVLNFSEALYAIWEFINKANKSIEVAAPWNLSKENKTQELGDFIYELMEELRVVTISIYPFMPSTADKVWRQLGLDGINAVKFEDITKYGLIAAGNAVRKGAPLFPRIKQ